MVMLFRDYHVPKASQVHFLGPDIGIETLAPILIQHQLVSVVDDGAQAVIDEVCSDEKTQREPNQRDDGDPFLPRVLGSLPWVVDLTLLDPSGAKVFLVLLLVMEVNGGGILGSTQRGCVEWVPRGGTDVVAAGVTCRLEGTTTVGGLLWCLVW